MVLRSLRLVSVVVKCSLIKRANGRGHTQEYFLTLGARQSEILQVKELNSYKVKP